MRLIGPGVIIIIIIRQFRISIPLDPNPAPQHLAAIEENLGKKPSCHFNSGKLVRKLRRTHPDTNCNFKLLLGAPVTVEAIDLLN